MNRRFTGPARAIVAAAVLGLATSCANAFPTIPAAGAKPQASSNTSTSTAPSSSASASAATSPPPIQVSPAAKAVKAQLGIQVFWHTLSDPATVNTDAARIFDYVVGLGANSVAISFPIYTDGVRPTRVYTVSDHTPTPATLQLVIEAAKARGLRVMLRPIIDETNIRDSANNWRGSIQPRSMSGWFASYQSVLQPYLVLAQQTHSDTFVVGTELDSLVSQRTLWHNLLTWAATQFSGELTYADNWGSWQTGRPTVATTLNGLDAYPQLHLGDSATVTQLTTAWTHWLENRSAAALKQTVIQEIGLPAISGAYSLPAQWATPEQTVVPQIQTKWFAASCQAAHNLDMAGVYFWNVDAYANPANAGSYTAGSFIGRGDQAIKACFTGWAS